MNNINPIQNTLDVDGSSNQPRKNLSFSFQFPILQVSWDQTSLGELKICPQKYKYSIIDGYETRDTNVHFVFGIEYHHSFEYYDHLQAQGKPYKEALELTIQNTLIRTWRQDLGRPWPSEDPYKNRGTLIRSIISYLEKFKNDPLETIILQDGTPAVELLFNFEIGAKSRLTGEAFTLCGRIDKLVMFEDRPAIVDKKTTKYTINQSFFMRFSPDNQVSAYLTAGEVVLHEPVHTMIIDAAQVKINSTDFKRGIVHRTPDQLHEWMKDTWIYLGHAETYAENNYWPRNDKSCGLPHLDPKTGEVRMGCPFREVCSSDPSVRQLKLDANFTRRVWDPIRPRELELDI